jgi:type VI secretion system protein ImpM
MACGLFGKLPPKRDFVAVAVPRAFLATWEAWLDAGLAESRQRLGPDWKSVFFEAPIWRFYLGRSICGAPFAGALMPSVDAVDRAYPLTLLAPAARLHEPAGTPLPAEDAWFARVEELLLGTLDPDRPFAATLDRLADLPDPTAVAAPKAGGTLYHAVQGPEMARPLSLLFDAAGDEIDATSFWWTQGGGATVPLAFSYQSMPEPALFTSMLTGRFAAPAPTS